MATTFKTLGGRDPAETGCLYLRDSCHLAPAEFFKYCQIIISFKKRSLDLCEMLDFKISALRKDSKILKMFPVQNTVLCFMRLLNPGFEDCLLKITSYMTFLNKKTILQNSNRHLRFSWNLFVTMCIFLGGKSKFWMVACFLVCVCVCVCV